MPTNDVSGRLRIVVLVAAFILVGCASIQPRDIDYALPNGARIDQPFPYQLVVKNFADERSANERMAMYPVGGVKSGDGWFRGALSQEVPQAIARDLAESNLFKTVVYAGDAQNAHPPNTLFLDGKIHSFEFREGNQSPSLGPEMRVKLSIRFLDSKGKVLWTSPARETFAAPSWSSLHWNESHRKGFPYLVKTFAECVRDLKKDILQFAKSKLAPEVPKAVATARPATKTKAQPKKEFPVQPVALRYRKGSARADDIAVIIGNANYSGQGKDIPDVTPAYADAEGFKRYALRSLGIREGNIIDLRDATQADMISIFGSREDHQGKLFNWVKANISNVYVYYAGHGAPAGSEGSAYLVPVNADADTISLNGYALTNLYANLGKIPAKSITVVIEACFSGRSEGGAVISNASPVFMKAETPEVPPNITVISAGGSNQMASWEEDKSHGLFTKYFLKGMSGEADSDPYGNGDGTVDWDELERYFQRTLTYYARRYYGREQTAQIVIGKSE